MKSRIRISLLAIGLALPGSRAVGSQEPAVSMVEFCDFQVPERVAQANATFTMAFTMVIGEGGQPTNIQTVEKHFLDDRIFADCIKGWRLPGTRGETVRVEFQWVHAKGWTNVGIMGTSFAQRLKIAPAACNATKK